MQVQILNEKGAKAGTPLKVSDKMLGAAFNEPLVHQVVVAYQAGGRAGTRAQKNRAAVRGGGSKPWRQKGTGHARAGSIRSPLWRGGGKVFPAAPRNFAQKVNKKMYRGAVRAILSELLRQGRLVVVDGLAIETPRTKVLAQKLNALGADNALIVTDQFDMNLALSARNLVGVDVVGVADADPVSLIRHDKVVMTSAAAKKFEETLG